MQCGSGSMEPAHGCRIIQKECIVSSPAKKSPNDDQENVSITIVSIDCHCQWTELTGAEFGIGDIEWWPE